jgi:hypothetical protein
MMEADTMCETLRIDSILIAKEDFIEFLAISFENFRMWYIILCKYFE